MRTTLNLRDDVYRQAKRYAAERSLPIGEAVSELLERGIKAPCPTKRLPNGLLVFDPPAGLPAVTSEQVRRLWEEER
jgi:hypothetical protein